MTPYYADDSVTLYNADCRDVEAWLAADVLVTDPPYGMAYKSGWSGSTVRNDHDTLARDDALAMWGERPALIFGRWSAPRPIGTRLVLTWDKGDWPGMGDLALPWGPSTEEVYVLGTGFVGRREGSVLRVARRPGPASEHPSWKPTELMAGLVARCAPSWVIADPFAGSGSTLVAAKMLGRRAIGVEIEERYCEIAARRLRQDVLGFEEVS
jgi:site-specific DNA-methyltransferase (adenine-specific)